MRKKRKSIIAISVALALVITLLLTITAQAGQSVQILNGIWYKDSSMTLSSGHYAVTRDVTYSGGLTVPSGNTVYIDIASGSTLTCNGVNAKHSSTSWGFNQTSEYYQQSTAGIVVEPGATLHLTGEGNLVVKGGDGFSAQEGARGLDYDVTCPYIRWFIKDGVIFAGGSGGRGGAGAIAPSAAIGGSGGIGGKRTNSVGAPTGTVEEDETNVYEVGSPGRDGNVGDDGSSMGNVYIEGSLQVMATAGGGSYQKAAAGGTFYANPYHVGTGGNVWTVHFTTGAPGGGGGGATSAAIIGGGGAGGGGGASGASGGYWALRSGDYSINTSYANATSGFGTTGGNGGKTAQPVATSNINGGKGAKGGTSGTGGILYISGDATVNGIAAQNLQQTDLGAATNTSMGQGAEVQHLTRVEVTAELDDVGYADREISLHTYGMSAIELSESKTTPGLYFGYVPTGENEYEIYADGVATGYKLTADTSETVTRALRFYTCQVDLTLDDSPYGPKGNHSVRLMRGTSVRAEMTEESVGIYTAIVLRDVNGNDTYAVYVDGTDYDKTLTVQKGVKVDAPFYTLTVNAKLHDGGSTSNLGDQAVGLYQGEKYITLMEEKTTGKYQAIVAGENKNGVIYYTIGVGEKRCAETLKAETGAERVVDFYNAAITLKDGANNWSGQAVALVGGGTVMNMAEVGTTGVYKLPLFGENDAEYTATVGGVPTTGRIKITDEAKRAATVNFFTATVNLTKDGAAWTEDASVMLKKNGKTAYILEQSGDGFTRKGIADGTYDVYVYGANSPADTGIDINSDTPQNVAYYTLTFHKNISGTTGDKVQTYQSGTMPAVDFVAYEPGYTFLNWKMGNSASSEDYVPAAITAKTEIYAAWVSPKLTLGTFVRCDENGTVNASGACLKFPNLLIQGYPTNRDVIGTMTITLENVKLVTNTPPYGWQNVGAWDSGSGNGSYVFRVDTGTNLTVAQAEAYLRGLVFQRNSESGNCSVQMSVFGDTN